MDKYKVLFIDDSFIDRTIFLEFLSDQYEGYVAENIEDAITVAKEVHPEIYICDVNLGNENGFDLIDRLRKECVQDNVHFIMLSVEGDKDNILRGIEKGVDDYMEKPIEKTTLNFAIDKLIESKIHKEKIAKYIREKEIQQLLEGLAHDISSPAMSILWTLQKLTKELGEKHPHVQKLNTNAKRIYEIITLVRELQSIISGSKKFILRPVSLKDTIHRSIDLIKEKLEEKKIEIEHNLIDAKVIAEEVSLSNMVIYNFINNAVKFSNPNTKITITMKESDDMVITEIKDHGVGIHPETLKDILSIKNIVKTKGTAGEIRIGYGLPLSVHYISLYNGEFSIDSVTTQMDENNHGTTVTLKLKKA